MEVLLLVTKNFIIFDIAKNLKCIQHLIELTTLRILLTSHHGWWWFANVSIRARIFLSLLQFRLMSFLSVDINKIFLYIFFSHFIRLFVTIFDDYIIPQGTAQRSNIFFGFIINSIVIFDLKNPQNLSKINILSRIVHVIHQFKIAATPNFGLMLRAG